MTDFPKTDPRQSSSVQQALSDIQPRQAARRTFRRADRIALLTYGLIIAGVLLLFYLQTIRMLAWPSAYETGLRKALRATGLVAGILVIQRLIRVLIRARVANPAVQYNLRRVVRLALTLLIGLIVVTTVFTNWYTTLLSLGVVSLILGVALQNPIASFFAWVYILIRRPFAVGDRIKIGSIAGDVVELGYFDTTLWEFRGDYLTADHPSGRLIRFANARVFQEYIINYSWPLFPYIWNELSFYISYESDLAFVRTTVESFTQQAIGEEMLERVRVYRDILKETPIHELDVREQPSVSFRANANTWIEVVVRYLVEPKETSSVRNQLLDGLLDELKKFPERVQFPKSNLR